jgi:hypothetical protein
MKSTCGCLALSYLFLSALTFFLVGAGMVWGNTPVTFMNCIAFVWMPVIILAAIFIAASPIIALAWVLKILF